VALTFLGRVPARLHSHSVRAQVKEGLLLGVEVGTDDHLGLGGSFLASERGQGVDNGRQHVKQFARLSIDDLLHFGQLFCAIGGSMSPRGRAVFCLA